MKGLQYSAIACYWKSFSTFPPLPCMFISHIPNPCSLLQNKLIELPGMYHFSYHAPCLPPRLKGDNFRQAQECNVYRGKWAKFSKPFQLLFHLLCDPSGAGTNTFLVARITNDAYCCAIAEWQRPLRYCRPPVVCLLNFTHFMKFSAPGYPRCQKRLRLCPYVAFVWHIG